MRRMIVNGHRCLVAFSVDEIPHSKSESEACALARDLHWLDTGIEVSPLVDLDPPTRAVN